MPDPCRTLNADSTAYVEIVASGNPARIYVEENFDSVTPPTEDLLAQMPFGSATPVKVPQGTGFTFTPHGTAQYFYDGQSAGGIKPSAGSVTLRVIQSRSL